MNEEFLRIKRIDTDTVVIPETNNKFEYHRLKDLLDEYYEWRVNKLNKSDVISSVCDCGYDDKGNTKICSKHLGEITGIL